VEEQSCGWVIDPGEPQLEAALRTALSAPSNALQEMAARGRDLVRARYSWESVGIQMGQVYDWILGGSVPDCVEVY
jgi:glycosyltransferase involved in cell wall biosynthesis